MKILSGAMLIAILLSSGVVLAEDAYYSVLIRDLNFMPEMAPRVWQRGEGLQPHIVLDGEGEAFLAQWRGRRPDPNEIIAIRAPEGQDVVGYLSILKQDESGVIRLKFIVPASAAKPEAKEAFYQTKEG